MAALFSVAAEAAPTGGSGDRRDRLARLRPQVDAFFDGVVANQALHELLRHPTIATCRDGSVLTAFAHLHQQLGEHAEALALMLRARACGFDGAVNWRTWATPTRHGPRCSMATRSCMRACGTTPMQTAAGMSV
ncbi:hypothetical protein NB693_20660 [Pantoea ananatis]|uniref:hypothetical protein n=1 Tax=Pantoea ananas TaxID=553 RepID=UPI00222014DD|nr:hypothetical protein [Pantoea ananatis]